ncbi:MAG: 50S ribosomal protein L17 [Candidatus Liptonbacteria bacterium]
MQHHKVGRKFHRVTGRRRSFLKTLVNELIKVGRIETTEIRAKAIRPIAEHYVTLAKKQNLAARRLLLSRLGNKSAVEKLMGDIAPRYAERKGGYLRIMKLGKSRKRDGSLLATIEFV